MDTFTEVLSILWDFFLKFWQFDLYTVDNNAITLGTLISAFFMIFVGYIWARRLSKQIAEKILTHFDIEASIRANITQLIFYALIIIFTLFVLQLLNVPLTIFTVVGGALAIGVGLGAQNIMNNFISGLVLMVERPISVGDLIDVGGLKGTVEEIGSRATKVKSVDNTHIIVPNSSFLQKNVLNWTLSDDIVRSKINLGVAYGSDTAKVKSVIESVIDGHSKVMKFPPPAILFDDFGDNSLNFSVHFYAHMSTFLEVRVICSDIRFALDAGFRAEGVTIAFPQRDVHLFTEKPLSVAIKSER